MTSAPLIRAHLVTILRRCSARSGWDRLRLRGRIDSMPPNRHVVNWSVNAVPFDFHRSRHRDTSDWPIGLPCLDRCQRWELALSPAPRPGGYCAATRPGAPRSIVMQPDDPSITPVSTAASAIALSIFLVLFVLIGRAFLLDESPWHLSANGYLMLYRQLGACAILFDRYGKFQGGRFISPRVSSSEPIDSSRCPSVWSPLPIGADQCSVAASGRKLAELGYEHPRYFRDYRRE